MAENETPKKQLGDYYLLGRSGLRVSPLCLGTMTFGTEWGWGADESASRSIFDAYIDAGGNFIDTADMYTNGKSEEMIGKFMRERKQRDDLVIATKFTFSMRPGDPNSGGNGRKHIMEAVDASLKRLGTDYIDLYWLHVWDGLTPEDEVMNTLDALVRHGKVRYIGLSDTPAWYLASAQRLAQWRGWEPVVALQLEYSLAERNIEREHVPAAEHFGMGICPWSPLASGLLSGKYSRENQKGGRLEQVANSGNEAFAKFTEQNFKIVDVLKDVAQKMGKSPAQVALNWVARRPQVVSTIIGATKINQLNDNLAALDFEIPDDLLARLNEVSAIPSQFPEMFYRGPIREGVHAQCKIAKQPPWRNG